MLTGGEIPPFLFSPYLVKSFQAIAFSAVISYL